MSSIFDDGRPLARNPIAASKTAAALARRARPAIDAAVVRLRAWAAAEAPGLGLWTPVALGAGALAYFSLAQEPPAALAPVLAVLFAIVAATAPRGRLLAVGAVLFAVGFALADLRVAAVDAPRLADSAWPRLVVGRIVSVDEEADRRRLLVAVRSVEGADRPPVRVRISWRGRALDAGPGDLVRFRAVLGPPAAPAIPGGYDYARTLFFQRIGATGYAVSPPRRVAERRRPVFASASAFVETARARLTRRILDAAPGQGGALVAASVTGARGPISAETEDALRDSGLAHLIAISGLNMALATGLVFFAVRLGLACIPAIALRHPIKKWAALAALVAGAVYLVLSGSAWSAVRAFVMAAIVFAAILFDRRALTMRNVAVAAVVILAPTPEAATEPGFQMSFAAVVALVAAFDWHRATFAHDGDVGPIVRLRRYAAGLVATDVVASSATGPFSLHHFHRAAVFGLPANIVAGPLVAFVLMPFAVLGVALMPLGLDAWAFRIAALGGAGVVEAGKLVAALPGGVVATPASPPIALGLVAFGGLFLALLSTPLRLAGLVPILAGAFLAVSARPPDLVVSADAAAAALYLPERRTLAIVGADEDDFVVRSWREAMGVPAHRALTRLRLAADCREGVCLVRRRGALLAVVSTPEATLRACRAGADLVVALGVAPNRRCAARLVSARETAAIGAHAVFIGRNGAIRITTVAAARGDRPWAP